MDLLPKAYPTPRIKYAPLLSHEGELSKAAKHLNDDMVVAEVRRALNAWYYSDDSIQG
jgi:hypothetical protein